MVSTRKLLKNSTYQPEFLTLIYIGFSFNFNFYFKLLIQKSRDYRTRLGKN